MSRLSKYAVKETADRNEMYETVVKNFMGGNSFTMSPVQTLKIIAASSIFAEPQYYREGLATPKTITNYSTISKYDIFSDMYGDSPKTAVEIFTTAIDKALSYNFKATLDLALELRTTYFMRLNPAIIFVRASIHPNRAAFNEANPGYMKKIGKTIALRPDDITNQFDYFMFLNGSKKGLSSILKRTWAERLEEFSRYQLNKYKGKSLIDLVRISHASNDNIAELMKTGTLKVLDSEQTWESLRSAGKTWTEILNTISMPHMALLRNLRNIFTEISDRDVAKAIVATLQGGVEKGMQFPFRYWSAYKMLSNSDIHNKQLILDGLEGCMDISLNNMPKLSGRVISLCDNSGSSHGALTSEYGSVKVSEIANLSALITGMQSDEGYVGVFGDRLDTRSVSTRNGILTQLEKSNDIGKRIGANTEHGIWLFWEKAIKEKQHWDTVFIYSDMQAGHGGLYGKDSDYFNCIHERSAGYHKFIDVLALVEKYRKEVNPKVNIFTVQVAGYDNAVLPENLYRGAILAGWTGKECHYADAIIKSWNSIENNGTSKNN